VGWLTDEAEPPCVFALSTLTLQISRGGCENTSHGRAQNNQYTKLELSHFAPTARPHPLSSIANRAFYHPGEAPSTVCRVGQRFESTTRLDHPLGKIAHVPSANNPSPQMRAQFSEIGCPPAKPKVSTKTATAIWPAIIVDRPAAIPILGNA